MGLQLEFRGGKRLYGIWRGKAYSLTDENQQRAMKFYSPKVHYQDSS